jgi:hypothetical protein
LRAIADELNERKVSTGQGGRQWYAACRQSALSDEGLAARSAALP